MSAKNLSSFESDRKYSQKGTVKIVCSKCNRNPSFI